MAEVGQAGRADEPGVAGAEECDSSHSGSAYWDLRGFKPFAIAIIVSFERLSSRELTTQ